MKSLKASSKGLDKIKKAMKQIQTEKGWTLDNDNWLDEAIKFLPMERIGDTEVPGTVSIGSWKRFYFRQNKINRTELACNHTFPIAEKLHLSLSVMFSATY